ncbi:hypothetical protein L1D46_17680 [Pseudoalteromonas sp. Isolate3]|uniref:hypothetical protein n=1 Tax=Pseudoalteromonas sp. Isolate3 TaxID=2908526 RepID=UPI001EFE1128|nr:hypothetical protein [Pseudoalteromonas sp. Isolate3]MCG9710622.1 hypothetical protein [Pseudoalteromonas sp. Isolate3]
MIKTPSEKDYLKALIIFAIIILLVAAWSFIRTFGKSVSNELTVWANTATFISGIATPLLSAISVFILYLVWKDNRIELAATKQALTEQSDTQSFSVIKDAVFDVAGEIKTELNRTVLFAYDEKRCFLELDSSNLYKSLIKETDSEFLDKKIIKLDLFLEYYYELFRPHDNIDLKPINSNALRQLIFSKPFYSCIDKTKMLGLFLSKVKSDEYKSILKITLFTKLGVYTCLLMTEISHRLYYDSKYNDDTALLVFREVAELTYSQREGKFFIKSLPDVVVNDLIKLKII